MPSTVELLTTFLAEYKRNPIDLLSIGDGAGESAYLEAHFKSFARTVDDVLAHVPRGGTILELGPFLGIVSITLADLGYTVHASELPEFCANPRLKALF